MAGSKKTAIKKVGDLMKSIAFTDRAFTSDRFAILTRESLSENQEITPEGFLLCKNVPIARTGDQLYTAEEIGLESRGDGLVKIQRTDDQVFHDETIASFEGKPVTIDHPDGVEVNPSNWQDLTIGIVQNVRRGTGIEDDLLLADLLITTQKGIDLVRGGLKEVSCGYDADYVQIEAGVGRQENITGNHVALVKRGRAGARCSIRDKETITMKTKKMGFLDKLRKFLDTEAAELEKEETKTVDADEDDENQDDKTKTGDDESGARLDALENSNAEIMKQLTAIMAAIKPTADSDEDDEDTNTQDSDEDDKDDQTQDDGDDLTEAKTAATNSEAVGVKLGDSMRDVIARAEILHPGIKVPSADSFKVKGAKEALMVKALASALEREGVKELVKPLLLGKPLAKLTGDSLKLAFVGASEMLKAHNNSKGIRNGVTTQDFGLSVSPSTINQRNRDYYANKK